MDLVRLASTAKRDAIVGLVGRLAADDCTLNALGIELVTECMGSL